MSIIQKAKQLVYPFLYREKVVYIPESSSFEGKVVLVAGGTGAVGEAICELLCRQGATIAIVGRDKEKLEVCAKRQADKRCLAIVGDITKPEDCERVAREVNDQFGRIDAVVNATGGFLFDGHKHITADQWQKLMDINVNAAFYLSKAVIPYLKNHKKGTIIHLGSKVSHNTNLKHGTVPYATTKYALEGLCYALNRELKKDHIRVCCLMPGTISTFLALNALQFLPPARVAQIVSMVLQMEDVDIESILFTSSFQTY